MFVRKCPSGWHLWKGRKESGWDRLPPRFHGELRSWNEPSGLSSIGVKWPSPHLDLSVNLGHPRAAHCGQGAPGAIPEEADSWEHLQLALPAAGASWRQIQVAYLCAHHNTFPGHCTPKFSPSTSPLISAWWPQRIGVQAERRWKAPSKGPNGAQCYGNLQCSLCNWFLVSVVRIDAWWFRYSWIY